MFIQTELFNQDQLNRHAKRLAAKHLVGQEHKSDLLLNRLDKNERILDRTYDSLQLANLNKRPISPAGEWLLDNFYIIEEQIATARRHLPKNYSRGLPHLSNTQSIGCPRVYDMALEVIAHVDGRIDEENITNFVRSYQEVTPLKIGEFWAFPIMLRFALIENLGRVAERVFVAIEERNLARRWAAEMLETAEQDASSIILKTADMARSNPPITHAFCAEFVHILHGQGNTFDIPLSWLEHQLSRIGKTTEQAILQEGREQAGNQVSVSASIASLRFLTAMDWRDFVESLNFLDEELRRDPAQVYNSMDFATRDSYRHAVENLAKKTGLEEWDVARFATRLAASSSQRQDEPNQHVGYYLVDKGQQTLLRDLRKNTTWDGLRYPSIALKFNIYFSAILIFTALLTGFVFYQVNLRPLGLSAFILLLILTGLCASQVGVALVNWLITLIVKPRLIPRMDFSEGVPADSRTMVVVPCLLIGKKNVMDLLADLEVRFLANRDKNIFFALLSDFTDASTETTPGDEILLKLVTEGIRSLNSRYADPKEIGEPFFLFHRARVWCPGEECWMGHERKRGKLSALNAALRFEGKVDATTPLAFSTLIGDTSLLSTIRYVITLDTDTQLPRDTAHKLIGAMAHPLNKPYYDPILGRITSGYSILQPRVAVSLSGASRSWFVRIFANEPGVDPYTRAVSDVYQDLFSEGSYIGKGIYDVDSFRLALEDKLPNNLILSHDLLEGCFARCGLISDILLYEESPHHFGEDMKRRRRWIRGDWQIAFWMGAFAPDAEYRWKRNRLSQVSKWKIFDNLRRSLVSTATVFLLFAGWILLSSPTHFTLLILALVFLPIPLTSVAEGLRSNPGLTTRLRLRSIFDSIFHQCTQMSLNMIFLLYDSWSSLSAIGTSLLRMFVTRRKLLEWNAATDPRHSSGHAVGDFFHSMKAAPLLVFCFILCLGPYSIFTENVVALPLLLTLWFFSPLAAYWLSRPVLSDSNQLTVRQFNYLRQMARKTWHFFDTFVGPADNWLPPDNFQEYPTPVVAHRTSPTNIGLSLLANLSAYDFGYISASQVVDRTTQTFMTMDRLKKYHGHFYNWYDTLTLEPLPPLYVSTVDSGNLVGLLLTLKSGLLELQKAKIVPPKALRGLEDTLGIVRNFVGIIPRHEMIDSVLQSQDRSVAHMLTVATELTTWLNQLNQTHVETRQGESVSEWPQLLRKQLFDTIENNLMTSMPWLYFTPSDSTHPSQSTSQSTSENILRLQQLLTDLNFDPDHQQIAELSDKISPLLEECLNSDPHHRNYLEKLRQSVHIASHRSTAYLLEIQKLVAWCDQFSTIEYDFLYDKTRHLLTIGYNASEHRRDSGYYDLLASEARLCSFIGIAQGHLPQEHWFALGRLLTIQKREPTLLSWSGSMFEYLMPLLVMRNYSHTLLDQSYKGAVRRQIEYGNKCKVPWGVSESGYNATDINLNYQYRAFGTPGLGFKRGLADDLVIAPYASVMALMVLPDEACKNMLQMSKLGFEGSYGFYEAIDYTPSRLPIGQTQVIVKSHMAHHQGMSLLSLSHLLNDQKMQNRFHSDPQIQATELLLHERVPRLAPFNPHNPETAGVTATSTEESESSMRVINTPHTSRPHVHLLSNGRYSVMITNAGGGYSRWKDLAVSRWREDPTCDNWGSFCYLHDIDNGEVWSSAYQPSLKPADQYEAIFTQARAEFRRRDHQLEVHTEITVSPEDDIELRRFTITNLSAKTRTIEITSFAEVVLAPQAADEAHAAFSNLFIQTRVIPEKQTIFCSRRARSQSEATPTLIHLMSVHGAAVGPLSYETDRARFIGRGRTVANPIAMENDDKMQYGTRSKNPRLLSGTDGSVLDPIVAIRCRITIEPEQSARVHVVTGVGETEDLAYELIEKYHDRHLADRVFELAWTHRQIVLRQLNIIEREAQLYTRLASTVVYANPLRRASPAVLKSSVRGQSSLWGYGISGDRPITMVRIASVARASIVSHLLRAHNYWHLMGLSSELIIIIEDDSSYRQDVYDEILRLISADSHPHFIDKPGGIYIRRAEQISELDLVLLQSVARSIITDSAGTLAEQIDRRPRKEVSIDPFVASRKRLIDQDPSDSGDAKPLNFSNGLGTFSPAGDEYIIQTSPSKPTPLPWSNVLANPYFGTVISESGSSYTWCENAHDFRLTPWHNDPVSDTSGEAIYIRNEETGNFWSPTPLPVKGCSFYLTRHGFGYSTFEHTSFQIQSKLTVFVAIDAPVKVFLLHLKNQSDRTVKLSLTGYCEWVLGELRAKSLMHVITEVDERTGAIFAINRYHQEFGARIGFLKINEVTRSVTGDRTEFIGRNGRMSDPDAMHRIHLSGKVGAALDPCAAVESLIELEPGQDKEVVLLLGVGRDVDDARTLIRRFGDVDSAYAALDAVQSYWKKILSTVQVKTPDDALDKMANGWLTYQVMACRLWARSGYYQSSGAFGFRDQLQDSMALIYAQPKLVREHILRAAAQQFRDGDVQHWWHPPSGRGVRTHFSDDFLWLPLTTSRYVLATGDEEILGTQVSFIEGLPVKPNEESNYDLPRRSEEKASLYEHCVRAIRNGLRFGSHGLPLIGCGDWNDGMNLIGKEGRGESVWLAFFLIEVLNQFSKIASLRDDHEFAAECLRHASNLKSTIESTSWDGSWYRRAYFDNGEPLGSATNSECQIDSLPQSWSVLSGAGDPQRSVIAMDSVDSRLVDRKNKLIKLFDPPFDKGNLNPGYIKGYVPGVRENGGQYTHAAVWSAMAFAALGDSRRAWEYLSMINPLNHSMTPQDIATYKAEPYVIAADVYGLDPHAGRGGWSWYTGAAGWTYRLIVESILGLRLENDSLHFTPCVPQEWSHYSITYRYKETSYLIMLRSFVASSTSLAAVLGHEKIYQGLVKVDGIETIGKFTVPLADDQRDHQVEIWY